MHNINSENHTPLKLSDVSAFIIAFWIITCAIMPVKVLSPSISNSLIYLGTILTTLICLNILRINKYFLLALFLYIFSMLISTSLQNVTLSTKDIFEFVKPIFWFCSFYFGAALARRNINWIKKYIYPLTLLQVTFSLLIYIPQAHGMVDLFKARPSDGALIIHFFRFSGTFAFPVELGLFLGMVVTITYTKCIMKPSSLDLFIMIVSASGLLLTSSRAAIAITTIGIIFITLMEIRRPKATMLLIISVAFLSAIFYQYSEELEYLIRSGFDILSDGSFRYRLREASIAIEALSASPLFGSGPSNIYYSDTHGPIESLFLSIVGRYGLIGASTFLLLIIYLFFPLPRNKYFIALTIYVAIAIFIGGISVSFLEQPKVSILIIATLGYLKGDSARGEVDRKPQSLPI